MRHQPISSDAQNAATPGEAPIKHNILYKNLFLNTSMKVFPLFDLYSFFNKV